jgi:hypothetical protein
MVKKGVPKTTVDRIRTLSKQDKSANQIQRILQREGRGIQRKKLLAYVRKFKGVKPKPQRYKYIPRKYRRPRPVIAKPRRPKRIYDKHVAIYGKHNGITKRIEIFGTGKYLQKEMYALVQHPPKKRFLRTTQDYFEKSRDLSRDSWDDRPTITS